MADHRSDRYAGRPLLILLENHALAAIGQLPPEHEASVSSAVAKLLGGDAREWKATVKTASGLPANFDDRLRELWSTQKAGLDPREFVMAVSDANFLPLVDPA